MVNENLKAIVENKKPIEEVREIENKIPSYEEFMKTYENDGNLNYDDLNGGSVGEARGYGPAKTSSLQHCESTFSLKVDCLNWAGGGGYTKHLRSSREALEYARELENGKYSNVSSQVEWKCASLIREAVRRYEGGRNIIGYIMVQGKFWGDYESSYDF